MTISINFNLPFNEAIAQMANRGVVLPDLYYGSLQVLHKQLAFSIANIAKLDQLQGVLDSLSEHLKNGGTFANWQKNVDVQSLGLPKHRLDNIFRTNIQQAYNHGHWQQALANQSTHGYLMYDAINDSRTRPSHKANDGIIRKIGDPIWKRIWFSRNVYRCRCRLISLTEKQAIARSGDGQGIYKTATEDPLRDTAWDNVDVMNADTLSFGVEQAVIKRLADSQNPALKQAFVKATEVINAQMILLALAVLKKDLELV
jgi:SPP1 gp7 family putative phage head morphogenesis protein